MSRYSINHQVIFITDLWVIGDSLVKRAEARANFRNAPNLSLPSRTVRWFGSGGMCWEQLRPKLQLTMIFEPQPAMILVHLGGNNLVETKQAKLMRAIKRDVRYIASVFPDSFIVWSDILPRKVWRGTSNDNGVLTRLNTKRKRINRAGRHAVSRLPLGRAIMHDIDLQTNGLFLDDGTHLTPVGNDIFLNTLQEAVATFFRDPTIKVYDPSA